MTGPVDDAEPRVLVAALVHQLGDFSLLDRAEQLLRRDGGPFAVESLPQGLADELSELVVQLTSSPLPPRALLDDAQLERLATWCVGEPVPVEYLALLREEVDLDGGDARRFEWTNNARPATAEGFRVAVIGAGFGGVLTGIRLGQAGIDYVIFEKNTTVGGTWFENNYPGLRVDVPSHFYSYSFAPNAEWSDQYARRDEIHAYIERCADEYGVREHVRLNEEVIAARYDERGGHWVVQTRRADGREAQQVFNAVVSAVGMLNRPQTPDIDGLESFVGPCFHSSDWDPAFDVTGKRVGVIGTGATSVQLVPAIAPIVEHLSVFQRSRHWVSPNPLYAEAIRDGERSLLAQLPTYATWARLLRFWQNADRIFSAFCVDPAWPEQDLAISLTNDKFRRRMTSYLRAELGNDESLIQRVLPDYPPFGKRILQDNQWFRSLCRDNVSLIDDGIDRVLPNGVLTRSGAFVELDVLVLATGFHANKFLWPIEFVGREGTRLHDVWGDSPRAYLGVTVPRFPNLFCIYGPNTNPVVGSVIFMLECQVGYTTECLRALIEGGWRAMDCRQDVHDEYNRRVDDEHERMVWRHPRVHSYYNNTAGRVTTNVPWKLIDYWKMTQTPHLEDYELMSTGEDSHASR